MGHAYAESQSAEEILGVDGLPIEDEGEPLGWFVSLLIESNANEE
jgi:hypothetical protein